jgi:hypothetical protein
VPTATTRRAPGIAHPHRHRPPSGLACLLAGLLATTLALGGCGSSGGVIHATAPPLPDTTGSATAAPSPTVSVSPSPSPPPPPPPPSATPSPSPGAGSEGGVERVPVDDTRGDATVAADLYPSSGAVSCPSPGSLGYGACPVTARLADRLNQHPVSGAEQLCRCDGTWQGVSITAPTVLPALDTYTVEVVLDLGSGRGKARLDVVVLRSADGWFADDILCHGGGQSTSIYASSPPTC